MTVRRDGHGFEGLSRTGGGRVMVGILAFALFVLPWAAVAAFLWLRPGRSLGAPSAPWRPLTLYTAPGDAQPTMPTGESAVVPLAGPARIAQPTTPSGATRH